MNRLLQRQFAKVISKASLPPQSYRIPSLTQTSSARYTSIKSLIQTNTNCQTNSYLQGISSTYSSLSNVPRYTYSDSSSSSSPSSSGPRFFDQRTNMSNHYVIREEEITEVLNRFHLSHRAGLSDTSFQVEWCPFCSKPHNNDRSNSYTLGIKRATGQFHCFRCSIRGSWWDFKNLMYKNVPLNEFRANSEFQTEVFSSLDDAEYYLYHNQLLEQNICKVELRHLTGKSKETDRFLDFETLVKYKVGIGKEEFMSPDGTLQKIPVVYFPMFKYVNKANDSDQSGLSAGSEDEGSSGLLNEDDLKDTNEKIGTTISTPTCKLVKCKVRGVGKLNKKYMRMMPTGSGSGVFGLNTVGENVKEIVITEGEYDAMAVYQATGMGAVSLPNGASSLPLDILGSFERFEKIYLWLDNDEAGRTNRRKLAEKLGLKRTYIVQTQDEKDANDILRQDASRIKKYINEAKTIPDQSILVFSDLMGNVLNRLQKSEINQGVRSRRFEFFNNTIKGLRKGELTVLTGPTGSGKTSFLSQLSLDFCEQETPTLWGSFEIKNEILATNMLMQMSGEDLVKSQEKFPYWSDRFNQLPLYFMNFFGSTNIEQILSTIDYAIYKFDIQHVVIDNLQFLMGTQARGISKFDMLDKAIESFRELATKRDIHMTVVIHPKKVDESEDLHISSVFGSAKATQEADNVVIIQSRDNYRVIDIKKNRYNGDVGKKGLIFDKANKNFYELTTTEVSDIINKRAPTELITKKRENLQQQIANEITAKEAIIKVVKKKKSDDGNSNDNGGSSPTPAGGSGNSGSASPASGSNGAAPIGGSAAAAAAASSGKKRSSKAASKAAKADGESIVAAAAVEKVFPPEDEIEGINYVTDEIVDSEAEMTAEVLAQETGMSKAEIAEEMGTSSKKKKQQLQEEEWEADQFEPIDSVEAIYSKHRVIPPKDHSMGLAELENKGRLQPWEYRQQQQQQNKQERTTVEVDQEDINDQIFNFQVKNRTQSTGDDILDKTKNKSLRREDQIQDEILKHNSNSQSQYKKRF